MIIIRSRSLAEAVSKSEREWARACQFGHIYISIIIIIVIIIIIIINNPTGGHFFVTYTIDRYTPPLYIYRHHQQSNWGSLFRDIHDR